LKNLFELKKNFNQDNNIESLMKKKLKLKKLFLKIIRNMKTQLNRILLSIIKKLVKILKL
jgi:hypothetical protein